VAMVDVEESELNRLRQHSADAKWLMSKYDAYRDKYGDEYVAVNRGKVLDHDKDLIKLRDRVKKRYGLETVFIQYIYKQRPRLIL